MRNFLLLVTLIIIGSSSMLVGCTTIIRPYRPPIQQGNVLPKAVVSQLHVGMTRQQVEQLLGSPMLKDTFQPQRMTYVYTYRPSRGAYYQKQIILYFRGNRLARILS